MEVVSPVPIPCPYLPRQILCPVSKDTILTHRVSEVDKRKMYSRFATEYDLTTEEHIASGAFGVVVQCKNIIDKQTYAIKKVSMGARGEDDEFGEYADLKREFIILAKFDHPSIVRYHTTWIEGTSVGKFEECDIDRTKPCLYIQQQLCECTLKKKLKEKLSMHECGRIFNEVVHGLEYIHSQNVMHGDLSTGNVFCYQGSVKIGDFGLSRIIGEPDDKIVLTAGLPSYVAPDEVVNAKADVYSLAIMLVEIIFSGKTSHEVALVLEGLKKEDPEFPPDWPDGVLKEWITNMLKFNPEERPSSAQIFEALQVITNAIENFAFLN